MTIREAPMMCLSNERGPRIPQMENQLGAAEKIDSQLLLAKSFMRNAPFVFIEGLADLVINPPAELRSFPPEAKLKLSVEGDAGSYCENDCRYYEMTLVVCGKPSSSVRLEDRNRQQFIASLVKT